MCLTTHYQWFSFVSLRSQTSFHIYLDLLVKLFYTRVGSVRSIFDSFSGVKSAAVRFFSFYFVRLNGCSLCKTQKNACWNLGILSACIRNKTERLHFYVRVVRKEESSHRNGKIGKRDRTAALWALEMELTILPTDPIPLLNRVWT